MDEYQHQRHQHYHLSSSSSSVSSKRTNSTSLWCWLAHWLFSVLPGVPKNWTILLVQVYNSRMWWRRKMFTLSIFAEVERNCTTPKIAIKLSTTIIVTLKFTINQCWLWRSVGRDKLGMPTVRHDHHGRSFKQLVWRHIYCVLTYLIQQCNRTRCKWWSTSPVFDDTMFCCKASQRDKSTGLR